jgi:hypothetical protein
VEIIAKIGWGYLKNILKSHWARIPKSFLI